MKRNYSVLGKLVFVLVICSVLAGAQDLQKGNTAFFQHKYDEALKYFQLATKTEKLMDDRAKAAYFEALVHFRIFKDFPAGRKVLTAAMEWSNSHSTVLSGFARLEKAAGNYNKAYNYADSAIKHAKKKIERSSANIVKAAAIVEQIRQVYTAKQVPTEEMMIKLQAVRPLLELEMSENPGDREVSDDLLDLALIQKDGQLAYNTWLIRFQLSNDAPGSGELIIAKKELARALPHWNSKHDTDKLRLKIISGLSKCFLYKSVNLFISTSPERIQHSPEIHKIKTVAEFARDTRDYCHEYYQTCAIGEEDVPGFYIGLLQRTVALVNSREGAEPFAVDMEKIKAVGKPVIEGYFKELIPVLAKEYKLYLTVGATAGYYDLHMGFILEKDQRVIEQHGQKATITLVNLDPMVSNGFQSWAWNYRAQHGGWATKEEIVRVAESYSDDAYKVWKTITDPEYIELYQKRIKKGTLEDEKLIKENPYCFLPGVSNRMYVQTWTGLKAKLEKRGFRGAELKMKFASAASKSILESSIFAHEGRHVIDKLSGMTNSADLEFYAKLSEIYFTSEPRRALGGGIFAANIGSSTGHGQANLRIVKGFVKWMEGHSEEIKDFDNSLPTLTQLDKLSDEQIKAAALSMDPLAK